MGTIFEYRDEDFFAYHALDEHTEPGHFSMHAHHDPEIYCFLSGKGQYRVEGTVYPLKAGDVLIMRTAETHMPEIDPDSTYERFVFNVTPEYLNKTDPTGTLWRMFFDRPLGKGNLYRPRCLADEDFLKMFAHKSEAAFPMRTALLSRLLTLLSECAVTYAGGEEPEKSVHTGRVTQIVRYLNNHLTEELTLDDIADRFYLSRSQLCRIFREGTGSGVMEYIRIKRLMAAREQIASGIPAGRAAAACGFSDYSSFYRAYKDRFGVSPTKKS